MKMKNDFDAEVFVDALLNAGNSACDSSAENFESSGKLPMFYDPEKFRRIFVVTTVSVGEEGNLLLVQRTPLFFSVNKNNDVEFNSPIKTCFKSLQKGQQFYQDNIFAMHFGKFIGLILTLSLRPVNALLKLTDKTSEPVNAYRRFLKTVFHMCCWYDGDLHPGSTSWKSISMVRSVHNGASRKGLAAGLGRISQREMALGQFGFVGLALVKPEMIGIHKYSNEELEGFVHFWRVLGHLFGVEERLNICRENLEETKQVCSLLLSKIFQPAVENPEGDFMCVSRAASEGLWCVNPMVEIDVFLAYISATLFEHSRLVVNLKPLRRLQLKLIAAIIATLRFAALRDFLNLWQRVTIWTMRRAPFLAYYKFGYKNARVKTGIDKRQCCVF